MIQFEFKIDGMTCVACSSTIERLMHSQFDTKGMTKVSIVLLTHKMQTIFHKKFFDDKIVTPEMICEKVDCVGFGCEFLAMNEIS